MMRSASREALARLRRHREENQGPAASAQTLIALAGDLYEVAVELSRRLALLDRVVGGKVHPITQALLRQAVTSQRKRSVTFAIDDLLDEAAALRERSVARVISAVELTDGQQTRLAAAL